MRAEEGGCLVYSIGSVGDSSFEASVYESISPACEIHTFDLNPWSYYTSREMPKFMNYHTQRIGKEPPSKTIPEIVKDLGHTDRTIDLFKIDCEGVGNWEGLEELLVVFPYGPYRDMLVPPPPPQSPIPIVSPTNTTLQHHPKP